MGGIYLRYFEDFVGLVRAVLLAEVDLMRWFVQ